MTDVQIDGTAIAKTPSKGLGDDKDRKDNTSCRIPERTQFTVADKNLVNNIIECAYQKGEYAGNRKFQHQF